MAPPVNKPGHPPDVTAMIVPKETDVKYALRDFKESVAKNVPLGSKETIVNNVLRDSRVGIVSNALRTTTEIIVVMN